MPIPIFEEIVRRIASQPETRWFLLPPPPGDAMRAATIPPLDQCYQPVLPYLPPKGDADLDAAQLKQSVQALLKRFDVFLSPDHGLRAMPSVDYLRPEMRLVWKGEARFIDQRFTLHQNVEAVDLDWL